MTLAFLLTSLVVVATPGSGALYTVAAVLHSSAVAFQTVKWAGVAYLMYLAWVTWRDKSELVPASTDSERQGSERPGLWRITWTGVAVNVLNPKLTLFFVAFLPQFIDPRRPPVGQMLSLSGVFMAMTFVVFVLYGVFAAGVRTHVIRRPRVVTWMRRTFATTSVALAARMAATTR
jgi:threonine/homoserine/homoserine lactone efflux protein